MANAHQASIEQTRANDLAWELADLDLVRSGKTWTPRPRMNCRRSAFDFSWCSVAFGSNYFRIKKGSD